MNEILLVVVIMLSSLWLSEEKPSKCLLISIDNRNLNPSINEGNYATISAVITRAYAKHHGYDFLYLQEDMDGLVDEVYNKYGDLIHEKKILQNNNLNAVPNAYADVKRKSTLADNSGTRKYSKNDMIQDLIPPTNVAKDEATAFHVGLLQFRAASWAKLPALWHVVDTIGHRYEYIWYLDSDATVSPLHFNISIQQKLASWESSSLLDASKNGTVSSGVAYGNRRVSEAALIFFNNHPWRDDMPCAGSFLLRPGPAEPLLREWWDFFLPSKNFKHFHEQDALWHMLLCGRDPVHCAPGWTGSDRPFRINSSSYSIVNERQFPSNWQRYEELWLCHIASYNYLQRSPILNRFLRAIHADTPDTFAQHVAELSKNHLQKVKLLPAAEKMEALSFSEPGRLLPGAFPAHDEATQSAFYDEHVTARRQEVVPPSVLYEGRLIRRKGEFWVVSNGSRHGFGSFEAFLRLGFAKELAFQLGVVDLSLIPAGHTLLLRGFRVDSHLSGDFKVVAEGEGEMHLRNSAEGRSCEVDPGLEKAVAANGSRSMLYLISHDNTSDHLSRKFAICKERWVRSVRISSTVFFESIVYREVFPQLLSEWTQLDFVITGTYKTVAKQLHYNGFTQTQAQIKQFLDVAKNHNYDIVPFLRSGSGMMSFCLYFHGQPFKEAWTALLLNMNYSLSTIRAMDETKPFYRNIYIIKPHALKKLMVFMDKAMFVAENNAQVKQLLQKDAKYKEGQEEVAMRVFHTKYYQLHPFIFERLPSFFFHAENMSICHGPDGPCKYNS